MKHVAIDPALPARLEARIQPATINYTMTPQRFQLEIPFEALADLDPVSEQRIHDMLAFWITQHRPPRLKGNT